MKKLTRFIACLGMLACAAVAQAEITVLINPGDQAEQSRSVVLTSWRGGVEQTLKRQKINDFQPSSVNPFDMTADLGAVRAKVPDVLVGPAHLIGASIRVGYSPVLAIDQRSRAVLVVKATSPVKNFEQAKGLRLGIPSQDSLVTYLVRGEAAAANTTIKRQFSSVRETRYQDALLVALNVGMVDVVAVEKVVFDRWLAAGEQLRVIMESREAPGMAVAVKDDAKFNLEQMRLALQDVLPSAVGLKTVSVTKDDFAYVSTLGYFTPRVLAGAKVVDAQAVSAMLKDGKGRYIDTRNDLEFNEGHVPGATLVPYVEASSKDPDFQSSMDKFDVTQLGPDKNAELIFGCNGPECWKSHKASIAALKAGYTNVNWFRGGVPEWRSAGLPLDAAKRQ